MEFTNLRLDQIQSLILIKFFNPKFRLMIKTNPKDQKFVLEDTIEVNL